jgi:hypothetical protein
LKSKKSSQILAGKPQNEQQGAVEPILPLLIELANNPPNAISA